ncbi:MAG: hypothetical protein E7L17_04955 [Clostridium sp.]|uniref:hypothetical protein n=1 Tax=Clostridium sp. TaxID=1506 RepID=UPI00290C4353|nr:hypothetical protein [Clostridium sp.]MDU7337447.1 hypothetical protein [Clostridium sp.]
MNWELKQINMPNPNDKGDYPNYENKLQPRRSFSNRELESLFYEHEKEIMTIVTHEIALYLSDESVCNDDEDMFPRGCEMTGEWYVGEVELFKEDDEIRGYVLTRFLGYNPPGSARMPIDDYLGLEVWVMFDPEQGKFVFEGGLNSSSI